MSNCIRNKKVGTRYRVKRNNPLVTRETPEQPRSFKTLKKRRKRLEKESFRPQTYTPQGTQVQMMTPKQSLTNGDILEGGQLPELVVTEKKEQGSNLLLWVLGGAAAYVLLKKKKK
jgi:hypothetical protein